MSEPTFEEAQQELESIVERLERGDAGIDELTKLWERGEELYRICAAKLEGHADLDVKIVATDQRFADALRQAIRRGRKGFEAMTTVADDDARIAFTNAEEKDDESFDLAASRLLLPVKV